MLSLYKKKAFGKFDEPQQNIKVTNKRWLLKQFVVQDLNFNATYRNTIRNTAAEMFGTVVAVKVCLHSFVYCRQQQVVRFIVVIFKL
ncbi:hypothetical protein CVS40_7704 [Lucilia cuprina]|nr:hypothetical protein CVS40_7704 [Lucilia cuprina]